MTRLAELIGKAKRAITRDGQTVSQKLETAQYALPLPARLSTLIEHDGDDLRDLPLIDRKRRQGQASRRDGQAAFPKNWSLRNMPGAVSVRERHSRMRPPLLMKA